MLQYLTFSAASLILCTLLFTRADASSRTGDLVSINCGSSTASSTTVSGTEWVGDHVRPKFSSLSSMKGSSSASSVRGELWNHVDPVPHRTARISRSQFAYTFRLNPGQKFIRLHFNPASYNGFKGFDDLFTVEAGPFTLLTNFSASRTALALNRITFAKEFCINVQESQPLDIIFTPAADATPSRGKFYAFINGIEIISVPLGLPYCHAGDIGVQVVGQKSLFYIDHTSALELVHRQNIKWDLDNVRGVGATILEEKADGITNNITCKVPVDVGFSYLIRLHFCELALKMAATGNNDFRVDINHVTAATSSDMIQEREDKGILRYRNFMVAVKGRRPEDKRDILISLLSKDEIFMDGHGPLEGIEIFKLSNDANSLASPTPIPLPRAQSSPSQPIRFLLPLHGRRNTTATVVITIICLASIIVNKLQQNWEADFCEEENKLSIRAKRLCRRFSLREIQSATENFYEAFVIGKGGFGKVYKGIINDSRETVAIKRFKSNSKQGKREFWTEIETLSEVRHVNIVSLIGYCNEQREMILVYEYQPCGTLADHLYKLSRKSKACSPLSWTQRLQICIGAGRGLDYLHTGHGIIHRDIKPSNILFDENFVPKISDFGLAKSESEREFQRQGSTNVKGTFGYLDPDYFRTRKLTTKSDSYSFGVVLLEVLCGRPAVEPPWVDEEKRSLTMWVRDKMNNGEVDQIVAPDLREEISPGSLKAFVRVAERCLHDDPKERPAISHVIISLEFALEQQENGKASLLSGITSVADFFPLVDKARQDNPEPLVPNEIESITDVLPSTNKAPKENTKSLLDNNGIISVTNLLPCDGTTLSSQSTKQGTTNIFTSLLKGQISSRMFRAGKRILRKTITHKLSRLWPRNALQNTARTSKKKKLASTLVSAPITHGMRSVTFKGSAVSENRIGIGINVLRIFTFSELKAATRKFSKDTVIGRGGFGIVYRGWIDAKSAAKAGKSLVAVKRLNPESCQSYEEWQSEVKFLGKLSHPNLVNLLGYCHADKELLLVYEYLSKGSLGTHLFSGKGGGPGVDPLQWGKRLKILIGVARGLAFLHALDTPVIHRDVKTSNILLDESYNAKLADFGLAKLGPTESCSHVSTRVMGTYGYAAPEYIETGHLYVKSDVYSFGAVLLEMLTGLRVIDVRRPPKQTNLVERLKPRLRNKRQVKNVVDSRLGGRYPAPDAVQIARLALNCLEHEPRSRPSMREIVDTLERMDSAVETPRQPRVSFG